MRKGGNDIKREKKQQSKGSRKFELEYERVSSSSEEFFFSSLFSKDLRAFKCKGCKKVIFPPSDICPFCGRKLTKAESIKVSNDAKVFSQTIVHYPIPFLQDFKYPFSIISFRISQTDTFVIVPSRNTGIYLGDRVKVFVKPGDKKKDISDIELEKL